MRRRRTWIRLLWQERIQRRRKLSVPKTSCLSSPFDWRRYEVFNELTSGILARGLSRCISFFPWTSAPFDCQRCEVFKWHFSKRIESAHVVFPVNQISSPKIFLALRRRLWYKVAVSMENVSRCWKDAVWPKHFPKREDGVNSTKIDFFWNAHDKTFSRLHPIADVRKIIFQMPRISRRHYALLTGCPYVRLLTVYGFETRFDLEIALHSDFVSPLT